MKVNKLRGQAVWDAMPSALLEAVGISLMVAAAVFCISVVVMTVMSILNHEEA
jgi:hypothetical protein